MTRRWTAHSSVTKSTTPTATGPRAIASRVSRNVTPRLGSLGRPTWPRHLSAKFRRAARTGRRLLYQPREVRIPKAQGIRVRSRPHDDSLIVRQRLIHIDIDRLRNGGIAPTSQFG